MNINIYCVGNIKEKFYVDAINEYTKRISRFAKINITEVKEEQLCKNFSNADILNVKKKESARLNEKISNGYTILLDVNGCGLSSEELAKKFKEVENISSTINFVIGGSYGVDYNELNKIDFKLSFSKMTFPHQLMRVILCEQVYRALTINNNITYHK